MKFKLITAFVKPSLTDRLVETMKAEGSTGATIIPARGTGIREGKTFFGLTIEHQTDIVVFLVEEHMTLKLLEVINERCEFKKPGTGIAFVLPLEHAIGLESQMGIFRNQARDEYL